MGGDRGSGKGGGFDWERVGKRRGGGRRGEEEWGIYAAGEDGCCGENFVR